MGDTKESREAKGRGKEHQQRERDIQEALEQEEAEEPLDEEIEDEDASADADVDAAPTDATDVGDDT